jgi:putative transcriptional regulator
MKKINTTQVVVKTGETAPVGNSDWTRIDAMSDEEVSSTAMSDPDARPLDATRLAAMRRVTPVKALREKLGMTQREFADAFGLPVGTLRDWEQRRSLPDAPARALLRAIEKEPETMRRLLSNAA